MEVVQQQDEVAFEPVQFIDQAVRDHNGRGEADALQKGARLWQRVGKKRLHCREEIGQKDTEVAVRFIQGNPGIGDVSGFEPGAQQRALAEAGRRGHQNQRAIQPAVQHCLQARTMQQVRRDARPVELRVQQVLAISGNDHGVH